VRHQIKDNPMPKVQWKHDDAGTKSRLTITSTPAPRSGRLWVAQAKSRDLRLSTWEEIPMTAEENSLSGGVDKPREGVLALYGEADFEVDGLAHPLSTQMRIVEAGE